MSGIVLLYLSFNMFIFKKKMSSLFSGFRYLLNRLSISLVVLLIYSTAIFAVTPLYYHTFAIAEIEAYVEGIRHIGVPTLDTNEFMQKKTLKESIFTGEVQKISLKVIRSIKFKKKEPMVPDIRVGEMLEVTNSYVDQKPPFKIGDKIKVRLRLVLPEEKYNPKDERLQWWFFPKGEKEDISPPRQPFKGIDP